MRHLTLRYLPLAWSGLARASYLYLRTSSVYPAVLMHAFNNAFAYVIIPVLA